MILCQYITNNIEELECYQTDSVKGQYNRIFSTHE